MVNYIKFNNKNYTKFEINQEDVDRFVYKIQFFDIQYTNIQLFVNTHCNMTLITK